MGNLNLNNQPMNKEEIKKGFQRLINYFGQDDVTGFREFLEKFIESYASAPTREVTEEEIENSSYEIFIDEDATKLERLQWIKGAEWYRTKSLSNTREVEEIEVRSYKEIEKECNRQVAMDYANRGLEAAAFIDGFYKSYEWRSELLTREEKRFLNKLKIHFCDAADGIELSNDKKTVFDKKAASKLIDIVHKLYPKSN